MTSARLPRGGEIDRDSVVRFRFEGATLEGRPGDTLASALLANGIDVVSSSPLLARPRGVTAAGVEEAGAFVEVTEPYFDALDDAAWADCLFMRDNPRGDFAERWYHAAGCRRWFNVVRSTETHEVRRSYPPGAPPPRSRP